MIRAVVHKNRANGTAFKKRSTSAAFKTRHGDLVWCGNSKWKRAVVRWQRVTCKKCRQMHDEMKWARARLRL